jgi:hypothetical protein
MKTVEAPRGRHWLIWPTGATEWMLTYSEELAINAKRCGWGCIEYAEVVAEDSHVLTDDYLRLRKALEDIVVLGADVKKFIVDLESPAFLQSIQNFKAFSFDDALNLAERALAKGDSK